MLIHSLLRFGVVIRRMFIGRLFWGISLVLASIVLKDPIRRSSLQDTHAFRHALGLKSGPLVLVFSQYAHHAHESALSTSRAHQEPRACFGVVVVATEARAIAVIVGLLCLRMEVVESRASRISPLSAIRTPWSSHPNE